MDLYVHLSRLLPTQTLQDDLGPGGWRALPTRDSYLGPEHWDFLRTCDKGEVGLVLRQQGGFLLYVHYRVPVEVPPCGRETPKCKVLRRTLVTHDAGAHTWRVSGYFYCQMLTPVFGDV